MLRLPLHLLALAHHLYVLYFYLYLHFAMENKPAIMLKIGRARFSFMTGWNFSAQTVYISLCVCEGIGNLFKGSSLAKLSQNKQAQHFKNLLFASIVFPTTCMVSGVFWLAFLYNRELLYPKEVDAVFPLWYNHSLHSMIFVVALGEMWLCERRYPRRWRCIAANTFFSIAYGISVLLTYFAREAWPYPILEWISWPMRITLFIAYMVSAMGIVILGEHLNKTFWGDTRKLERNGAVKKVS